MNMIRGAWNMAGDIYLTLGIIICMILDLTWGFFILRRHSHLFSPINDQGFMKWAATWGSESYATTLWLFILIGLVALLAINTFVCTTHRVILLVRFRHRFKNRWHFILRFGPHIMHYSMLIMFIGYLFSYLLSGTHMGKVLLPGKHITIDQTRIELQEIRIDYYHGTRMTYQENRAIRVAAVLKLNRGEKTKIAELSFNHPVIFNGLSIHLKDFRPKTETSRMGDKRRYVTVTVKKDPGMGFYFAGMAFFVLGLFMYVWDKISINRSALLQEQVMEDAGMEVK